MSGGNILYPNVTSLPGTSGVGQGSPTPKKDVPVKGEFDAAFNQALSKEQAPDLSQVRPALKFSSHASQRLKDRKIELDPAVMAKVNDAIDKADAKGVQDTLVLTKDAALIVNVKNRTVITAMDRNALNGNVFTNIDGAVIV
jgi:flagellar operon protein